MLIKKLKLEGKKIYFATAITSLTKFDNHITTNIDESDIILFQLQNFSDTPDIINLFLNSQDSDNRRIYIFYPKISAPGYSTTFKRDEVMNSAEELGLQAISLINVDENFSCMIFKKPQPKNSNKPSQCVDDYINYIDILQTQLVPYPELLCFFNKLTFGYQKGWARYVYGVIKPETQQKRFNLMKEQLSNGVKSP